MFGRLIVRRVLEGIAALVVLSVVIFVLLRLLPGGTAQAYLGDRATPQDVAALNRQFGLDRPITVQYASWIGDTLKLNLGTSLQRGHEPVTKIIGDHLNPTVELAILAVLISGIVGTAVGILGAARQNSGWDYLPRLVTIALLAIPEFWLASMVLIVAARLLHWSPPARYSSLWANPRANLAQLAFPALVLGVIYSALITRLVRSTMLDVLSADYIRTARAKGLTARVVLARHAMRNSLLPVVTLLGIQFGRMLGGVVIAEVLFSIPGMGQTLLSAIGRRDFPVVQGIVLFVGAAFILINLLVDVSYGMLDPRIRGAS